MIRPRIRTLNALPATHMEKQVILLQDPLGIASKSVLIPVEITPLLILCDGTRSLEQIQYELARVYGFKLEQTEIDAWMNLLDEAAMLDNENFRARKSQAIKAFRESECRPMTLSDDIYPADAGALRERLNLHLSNAEIFMGLNGIEGMICPHIDYSRGWRVYAQLMANAREAVKQADLMIILGTDHFDDGNPISMTLQSYQTPLGTLQTPPEIVSAISDAIPEINPFNGELRHRFEHSIELALIWLHHMRDGDPCDVVPILCGAHDLFFHSDLKCEQPWVPRLLDKLAELTADTNSLVIAAADLSHVGLAFGGSAVPRSKRVDIAMADERLLQQVKDGSPGSFINEIIGVNDRYNVCGITPIYLLLRLLEPVRGEVLGYELCPADEEGTSWVSICGALLSGSPM